MTERDLAKMAGCHPDLIAKLGKVLTAMAALGFPMMVTDGVRTFAQQQALYAQGRSAIGGVVTNADGVPKEQGGHGVSNHQLKLDGFGHAADCAFLVDGVPSWDTRLPWKAYGAAAVAVGLTWGGDWQSLRDLPHVEL